MKTIRVSDTTHEQLLKIAGEIQRKTGKNATTEDAVKHLLERKQ